MKLPRNSPFKVVGILTGRCSNVDDCAVIIEIRISGKRGGDKSQTSREGIFKGRSRDYCSHRLSLLHSLRILRREMVYGPASSETVDVGIYGPIAVCSNKHGRRSNVS